MDPIGTRGGEPLGQGLSAPPIYQFLNIMGICFLALIAETYLNISVLPGFVPTNMKLFRIS